MSDNEVHGVAQRLRAGGTRGDDRAQQERQVHPRQPELAGGAQRGSQDQRPDETAATAPRRSRRLCLVHRNRCVDQSELDQPLRNVSQELTADLIHLLGVEPDVVRYTHQLVHQLGRGVDASGSGESVDEPERAAQQRPFASREPAASVVRRGRSRAGSDRERDARARGVVSRGRLRLGLARISAARSPGQLGDERTRTVAGPPREGCLYLDGMASAGSPAYDRVVERRRAVALARHFREAEGLSTAQIADRLGRSPATIKAYFYDPVLA